MAPLKRKVVGEELSLPPCFMTETTERIAFGDVYDEMPRNFTVYCLSSDVWHHFLWRKYADVSEEAASWILRENYDYDYYYYDNGDV